MGERRIGAYGGTFDPVHNGHVEVMRAVTRQFKLDTLLVIPAHRPPHKTTRQITDAYHRFAMAALATLDEERAFVSTVELDEPERPYSFQTVERLRAAYGERARLFFIVGADSFEEIGSWREPERLLATTNLVVVTRPGHDVKSARSSIIDLRGSAGGAAELDERGCCKIYLTDLVFNDVSSSEVRRRALGGESIGGMVPAAVARYIEKYGLYRR